MKRLHTWNKTSVVNYELHVNFSSDAQNLKSFPATLTANLRPFLTITFNTNAWLLPPQSCRCPIVGLPQPQSALHRREPPAETACRTVTAWWRGRCVRNGAENTCRSLLVLVSPLNFSFIGRAPAARWAASLSKTIWGSDQCHLV